MPNEPKGACLECGGLGEGQCICARTDELGIHNGGKKRERRRRRTDGGHALEDLAANGGEDERAPLEGVTWTDENQGIVEVELTDPMIEWLDIEAAEHNEDSVPDMIRYILRAWLADDLAKQHGPHREPEIDVPADYAHRARLYHNHSTLHGNDQQLEALLQNYMTFRPVFTLDSEPLGSDRSEVDDDE